MTRGRKRDHTIPRTRSLTLQRDFRARKAQYISNLESRCKAIEEENVRLREELELAKKGVPYMFGVEAVRIIMLSPFQIFPSSSMYRLRPQQT
jgi:hypothetical protein